MNDTNANPTRQAAAPQEKVLDYAFFRQKGIECLEQLTGSNWSDFNAHDPGITILEQVCYALSDLSYRNAHTLSDLLCGDGASTYTSLYRPTQILPTAPLTLLDLRQYLVGLRGVRNAAIDPVQHVLASLDQSRNELKMIAQSETINLSSLALPIIMQGLLSVSVATDVSIDSDPDPNQLTSEVIRRLHRHRSLGQDFQAIQLMAQQTVGIQASIEVATVQDRTALLADIYRVIDHYMSPSVSVYSVNSMQQKGCSIEEILDGPLPKHGLIDRSELTRLQRRSSLQTSDLIDQLAQMPGIRVIKKLEFIDEASQRHEWILPIKDGKIAHFKLPERGTMGIHIQLEQDGIPIVDATVQQQAVALFEQTDVGSTVPPTSNAEMEQAFDLPPQGRDRRVGDYSSILRQFPGVYGVGEAGLPESAPAQRKVMAKQLKAYLMFFDQLLANQFAQLSNVSKLFSYQDDSNDSYFSQPVGDADGKLGLAAIRTLSPDGLRQLTEDPSDPENASGTRRRNRFMDHLLARFGRDFRHSELLATDPAQHMQRKRAFMRDYVRVGHDRGLGFDYLQAGIDRNNISGLERTLGHQLGLSTLSDAEYADLRFYLVEHVLLRPIPSDQYQKDGSLLQLHEDASGNDPYSLQLTLVFAETWLDHHLDATFVQKQQLSTLTESEQQTVVDAEKHKIRQLVEQIVLEETPAHLHANILWKPAADMTTFIHAYQRWAEQWRTYRTAEFAGTLDSADHQIPLRSARDHLIDLLEIGTSTPLSDLNIVSEILKVTYESTAKIQIEHAQTGVSYRLCDSAGTEVKTDHTNAFIQGEGDGNTLTIETPPITEDITYRIEIFKQSPRYKRRFLSEHASIKVGLNTSLGVQFADNPALTPLDAGKTDRSDPHIVNYGENKSINIEVLYSQEGVQYTLILDGVEVPASTVTGNLATITLATGRIDEDTHIQVQAKKSFDGDLDKPDEIVILEASLYLKVRANPQLELALNAPILGYQDDLAITISNTQESAAYRLWTRTITDSEFIYSAGSGESLIETAKPELKVQALAGLAQPFQVPDGFQPATAEYAHGTGGDLVLSLQALQDDTLILIEARKAHFVPGDAKVYGSSDTTYPSSVALAKAPVVLVEPDPARQLSASVPPNAPDSSDRTEISGGQPGVYYYYRPGGAGAAEAALPVYFHKHAKGLGKIRLEIDFAIADAANEGSDPPLPIIDIPFNAAGSVELSRAKKARTGVEINLPAGTVLQI